MNITTLTMGDWSHDGHGMSETVTIESNLTRDELIAAYNEGIKITGLDLENDVAANYGETEFPNEGLDKLAPFDFPVEDLTESDWRHEKSDIHSGRAVSTDNFHLIWLFIAKVGNPRLKYKVVKRSVTNINIGGYGLFSS